MDANPKAPGASGRRRWTMLVAATACFAATTAEVDAAPMRGGARLAAMERRAPNGFTGLHLPPAWRSFLDMGPEGWGAYQSPPFTIPTRLAVWRMLEDAAWTTELDPMLEYLIWRRDLNAARFDRFHPFLGPRLGQILRPPAPLVPPIEIPELPHGITPPPPLVVPDNPVPEPTGLVIAALASAWGLWRRWRSRAVPAR